MPASITRAVPVLLVRDLDAAVAYWRDKVGFDPGMSWGNSHRFSTLSRDGQGIILGEVHDPADIKPYWTIVDKLWNIYFWVDDVEALYAELQERGATIDYTLYTTYHGETPIKEFGIQDADGHDIGFGQVMT